MIGTITDDYKLALEVKESINKIKVVKHSESISHIHGYHQMVFMYSDDYSKEEHKLDMVSKGWNVVDGQSNVSIYGNIHEGKFVRVPCGIYEKEIEVIPLTL